MIVIKYKCYSYKFVNNKSFEYYIIFAWHPPNPFTVTSFLEGNINGGIKNVDVDSTFNYAFIHLRLSILNRSIHHLYNV